jgi:hypothetical protein
MVKLIKSFSNQIKFQVQLSFVITQHCRDAELIKSLVAYLGCGKASITKRGEVTFEVRKLLDQTEKIISFFSKYPILGVKSKDFDDFCKVADIMEQKKHLTEKGLNQIREIRASMNSSRNNEDREGEVATLPYLESPIEERSLNKVPVSRKNILLNNQNNNITISSKLMNIQSAENCKGFSETTRQLPDIKDYNF